MSAPAPVVAGSVVDIRTDRPVSTDVFLVDTNVWYWAAYSRASQSSSAPTGSQIRAYPSYLQRALEGKSTLLRCGLCLLELAHLIEQVEHEISRTVEPLKAFRRDIPLRTKVVNEMRSTWTQVRQFAQPVNATLKDTLLLPALDRLQACPIDFVDAALVETAAIAKVDKIVTDDSDFATVPGITIFTANRAVIEAAKDQGKLVTR